MSVGKRLRFEVLKRDGFRCRYCGSTAVATALHVDHVIAVANGGTDDPVNLVTSCVGCNSGKSDVPLESSQLTPADPLELAREHVEQIRAYLEAQKAVDAERQQVADYFLDRWREVVGNDPPSAIVWRNVIAQHPMSRIADAIDAVAASAWRLNTARAECQYFYGCLRRKAEEQL